jgi:hypothetical protein
MIQFRILSVILTLLLSTSAFALEERVFCVWDPVGRTGPVMTFYSDVIPKAQAWGLNIRFKAFTEETDVVEQFKAEKCEAAVLTSILSRQFVKFAGTMDAIGAINSKKGLELAIATLSRERAGKLMIEANYEVVTTFPVGSMYAFVKDRNVDTIDEFAGKKLAILNRDPQMYKFASLSSSIPVPVTLSNFADKFKTGEVEIVIMPALAYNTFELYEGLGKKGGIIDYRLYYGMLQTIARRDQFPEDFGSKMRNYMLTRMKAMNKMVVDAEQEIPQKYWIKTNQFVKDEIDHFSKRIRLALQDDEINNPTALKLFWKIRCRLDPSRGECKTPPSSISQRKKIQERNKRQAEKLIEKKEAERIALEAQKAEQERIAKEQAEQERLEQQKAAEEQQRIAQEKAKAEQKRIAKQKAIAEQKRIEEERLALEQAEKARNEEQRRLLALEKNQKLESRQVEQTERLSKQDSISDQEKAPATKSKVTPKETARLQVQQQAQKPESNEAEEDDGWSLWDFLFGWI